MKTAVYPGSFDPVTNGHLNIIKRANKIIDKIIIVVCDNPQKDTLFSAQKRAEIIRENTQHFSDVEVTIWRGLLVDFLEEEGINLIIRGLRATSDFEEEFQMALMNKKLNKDIETIMLVSDAKYNYLSSSSVKEVFQFDGCISGLVPDNVKKELNDKFK